jgi:hypothetical protein
MVTVTLINLLHFAYRLAFCRVPTAAQSALASRGVSISPVESISYSTTDPPLAGTIIAHLNDPENPAPFNSNTNTTNFTITRRSAKALLQEKSVGSQIAQAESSVKTTGMHIDVASDIKNPHAEGFCAVQDAPHLAMVLIAALVNVCADIVFLLLPLKEMLRGLRERRWHKLVVVVMILASA